MGNLGIQARGQFVDALHSRTILWLLSAAATARTAALLARLLLLWLWLWLRVVRVQDEGASERSQQRGADSADAQILLTRPHQVCHFLRSEQCRLYFATSERLRTCSRQAMTSFLTAASLRACTP